MNKDTMMFLAMLDYDASEDNYTIQSLLNLQSSIVHYSSLFQYFFYWFTIVSTPAENS